jgi:anti-sigma B factor antagonist
VKALPLEIHSSSQAGGARLELCGELDIGSAPLLEDAAERVFAEHARGLVVDLSDVSFVDSTGLRILIALNDRAAKEGCALTLVAPPEPARSVFHITGAYDNLPFVEEAPEP